MRLFVFFRQSIEPRLLKYFRKLALHGWVLGVCLFVASCSGPMDGYKSEYRNLASDITKTMNSAQGTYTEEWSGDQDIECSNLLKVRDAVIEYKLHLLSLPVEVLVKIQEHPEDPWVESMKEEIDGTVRDLRSSLAALKADIRRNSSEYPNRASSTAFGMGNIMYPRGFYGFFDNRLWIIAGPGDGSEVYVIDDLLKMSGKEWIASATEQFGK